MSISKVANSLCHGSTTLSHVLSKSHSLDANETLTRDCVPQRFDQLSFCLGDVIDIPSINQVWPAEESRSHTWQTRIVRPIPSRSAPMPFSDLDSVTSKVYSFSTGL